MSKHFSLSKREEIFLRERLRHEWDMAERAMKRHTLVEYSKKVGKVLAKSMYALLVLGGVVTITAVAPNVFAAYGKLLRRRRFYDASAFTETLQYMRKRKYVLAKKTNDGYNLTLTPAGKQIAFSDALKEMRILSQKEWDGTWWVVIFDIPRRHNAERNALREKLRMLGMEQIQNSVYVSRYPCRDEVLFLARLLSVSHFVSIMHVTSIEDF